MRAQPSGLLPPEIRQPVIAFFICGGAVGLPVSYQDDLCQIFGSLWFSKRLSKVARQMQHRQDVFLNCANGNGNYGRKFKGLT